MPPPARTFTVVVNELLVTCHRYRTSPLALSSAAIVASVIRLPDPGSNTSVFDSLTDEVEPVCALKMLVVPA